MQSKVSSTAAGLMQTGLRMCKLPCRVYCLRCQIQLESCIGLLIANVYQCQENLAVTTSSSLLKTAPDQATYLLTRGSLRVCIKCQIIVCCCIVLGKTTKTTKQLTPLSPLMRRIRHLILLLQVFDEEAGIAVLQDWEAHENPARAIGVFRLWPRHRQFWIEGSKKRRRWQTIDCIQLKRRHSLIAKDFMAFTKEVSMGS